MAKHRSRSVEFKRQIAQDFIAGETLNAFAKRQTLEVEAVYLMDYETFEEVTADLPRFIR